MDLVGEGEWWLIAIVYSDMAAIWGGKRGTSFVMVTMSVPYACSAIERAGDADQGKMRCSDYHRYGFPFPLSSSSLRRLLIFSQCR